MIDGIRSRIPDPLRIDSLHVSCFKRRAGKKEIRIVNTKEAHRGPKKAL
jgi:hypothetical protein